MAASDDRHKAMYIDQHERAHSAKCRAQTLREVAAAMKDARARQILLAQAEAWDRQAHAAEQLAASEEAPPYRHKRLKSQH